MGLKDSHLLKLPTYFVLILAVLAAVDNHIYLWLKSFTVYFGLLELIGLSNYLEFDCRMWDGDLSYEEVLQDRVIPIPVYEKFEDLDRSKPGLIRGASPNCLETLSQYESDQTVEMYEVEPIGVGYLWAGGSHYTENIESLHLQSFFNGSQTFTDRYSSFQQMLIQDAMHKITPDYFDDVDFHVDHGFFANFSMAGISTGIHAAGGVASWTIMCAGTKKWLLWDRVGLRASQVITTPTIVPIKQDENVLFGKGIPVYGGVQQAGDLLYFPPSAMHLVYTDIGPNIMFNFRELNLKLSFEVDPYFTASMLGFRMLEGLRVRIEKFKNAINPWGGTRGFYNPLKDRNYLEGFFKESLRRYCSPRDGAGSPLLRHIYENMPCPKCT